MTNHITQPRHPFLACASLLLLSTLLPAQESQATVTPLTPAQCQSMQDNKVYSNANPVKCERLAHVSFRYLDFAGQIQEHGSVVVLDIVAHQVQGIFDDLFKQRFPIHQAQPLENYYGDDQASMNDNNSSAFNGRPITGGTTWSKHAYGVAIDINPLQNPYISKENNKQNTILPPAAFPQYIKRTTHYPGMAEDALDVFFKHGFMIWGGNWKQPIDYQHFEIGSRTFIDRLIAMPKDAGQREFDRYAKAYQNCVTHSQITPLPMRYQSCSDQTKQ